MDWQVFLIWLNMANGSIRIMVQSQDAEVDLRHHLQKTRCETPMSETVNIKTMSDLELASIAQKAYDDLMRNQFNVQAIQQEIAFRQAKVKH
jgi:hypothetical protein